MAWHDAKKVVQLSDQVESSLIDRSIVLRCRADRLESRPAHVLLKGKDLVGRFIGRCNQMALQRFVRLVVEWFGRNARVERQNRIKNQESRSSGKKIIS